MVTPRGLAASRSIEPLVLSSGGACPSQNPQGVRAARNSLSGEAPGTQVPAHSTKRILGAAALFN